MFIPIRDYNRARNLPLITGVLITANIAIFALTAFRPDFIRIVYRFGLIPSRPIFHTCFTSLFLHGGFFHLIGNMWFLWLFGDNVEDRLGHLYFLLFYLTSGIVAGGFHIWLTEFSRQPAIGASGAIAGITGAYLVLYPRANIEIFYWFWFFFIGTFTVSAFFFIGLWFIFQLLFGFAGLMGRVAFLAHIGGFLFGVMVALFIRSGTRRSP